MLVPRRVSILKLAGNSPKKLDRAPVSSPYGASEKKMSHGNKNPFEISKEIVVGSSM